MIVLDRILSALMILAGIWHAVGSIRYYQDEMTVLWALCSSMFIVLFGVVSLLRASRPGDKPLACISLVSGIAWVWATLRFASITERFADWHVLVVLIITIGMCIFSVRSMMLGKSQERTAARV